MDTLTFRPIEASDCSVISQAFKDQGWDKPVAQFLQYVEEQAEGIRSVVLVEVNGVFAGYLTICWLASYPPFRRKQIPEIADLNVLKKFQRQGIGNALMECAEELVAAKSEMIGICFGVTGDYGTAQRLYVKRGYVPDGRGLIYKGQRVGYGDQLTVDDDLMICLTKKLNAR